jgi:FtsP/CotA-like multicopper oxidase with cupredoxin domain
MVIGVMIRDRASTRVRSEPIARAPRQLTLVMRTRPGDSGDAPAAGFVLSEGAAAAAAESAAAPGPTIVLRRDEPVEITLVNRLAEPTAIHWHGIELDSYYDGVHGFSGLGRQVTPMIEPGGRFVVRFTPPRAGTFIYHTHLHDYRQLSSGLYGPIVVTDTGETFDPVTDHVVVIARNALTSAAPSLLTEPDSVVMNGARAPRLVWKAGVRHRVRLINITPDDIFSVTLQASDGPVTWTPVAKDGAPVPAAEAIAVPARQTIAVGETYDFDYQAPAGRKSAWLEVRTPGGKWQIQGHVILR